MAPPDGGTIISSSNHPTVIYLRLTDFIFYLVTNIVPYCKICAPKNQLSFLALRLSSKQTYYILPVDRYITKIAGTLYPGGHLIIKNRYFNSSVTTRLRHLLLCLTHIMALPVMEFQVHSQMLGNIL